MGDHGAAGLGIQHSIEHKVISVDGLACDFLNSIGPQMRMPNGFVRVNRIGDVSAS